MGRHIFVTSLSSLNDDLSVVDNVHASHQESEHKVGKAVSTLA